MSCFWGIVPIVIGFMLDLWLGDPPNWPHPVRWIGSSINFLQQRIRKVCQSEMSLKWGGLALWIVIVGGTYWVTWGVIYVLALGSFWLSLMVQCLLAYSILATKCLKDAAVTVFQALDMGTVEEAREKLSYIVGRDTSQLDKPQITRAVVETVAENTVDGIIAPLFYLFIGGVPLAMAYKAVNTLDSMVGYKTPKYQAIGYCSAKLDDVFNYFPARISWLLFTLAAYWMKLNAKAALLIGWRDRYQHKSPNCAWSEATVAGALGIRLGGPNCYFGELVEKPWLGDETRSIAQQDIQITIALMYRVALLALILFAVIDCTIYWLS
ncbi:cobalamin biosynthesis protein [Entomomonas moraniae]|uniref:Cobalamin biosynthesis protein CobD n=1 Tax=Entomomonas moraniae TaxID=2213226 RepID=A0A3S9XBR1_9GAMM|nr:adenosylcobinamide-phosphate synthase CbiB [Entomomonas moraniae]AZS49859.1 cobalamin biosynthesis protein [Entomomonas moraniae]